MKRYIIRMMLRAADQKVETAYSDSLKKAQQWVGQSYPRTEWDSFRLTPKDVPPALNTPIPQRLVSCWTARINSIKDPVVAVIFLVEDPPATKLYKIGASEKARNTLRAILEKDLVLLPPVPGEGMLTTIAHDGVVVAVHWRNIPGGSSQKEAHAVTIPMNMARALSKKDD